MHAEPPAPSSPSATTRTTAFGPLLACLLVAGITGAALMLALDLRAVPEARMINVFYWFQREFEPVPLAISLASVLLLAFALIRGRSAPETDRATSLLVGGADISTRAAWAVGAAVTLVTFAITHLVMHNYALSGDEWSASFQARIFARGMLAAPVPVEWRPWATAMLPHYIRYDAATGTWESMYLPVYAAIRSLFVRLGAESLTNPVLAGLTIVGVAGVARRLWPGEGRMQWLAVGALVTSSQFLLMSGTAYAMPAHLCLNTWWLWCWLRREESGWYVAALPVIGVAALGLHQPFPHALFVAPFLVRLLFERRWGRTIGVAIVYLAGCTLWLLWMQRIDARRGYALLTIFNAPKFMLTTTNAALILTWTSPVLGTACLALLPAWRTVSRELRDCLAGIVLTLVVYMCYQFDQQHGWGYRYMYPMLTNVALLFSVGARSMARTISLRDFRGLTVLAGTYAVAMLFTRAVQARTFVQPFVAANQAIRTAGARAALIPVDSVWYGTDLVRNDPFLSEPTIVLSLEPQPGHPLPPPLPGTLTTTTFTAAKLAPHHYPLRNMGVARRMLP